MDPECREDRSRNQHREVANINIMGCLGHVDLEMIYFYRHYRSGDLSESGTAISIPGYSNLG